MKKAAYLSRAGLMAAILGIVVGGPAHAVFTRVQVKALAAAATLGSGSSGTGGALALNIPQLLPTQAFFGKNIVIPVQLQGNAGAIAQVQTLGAASGVSTQMLYQEFNSGGVAVGRVNAVPVTFQSTTNDPTTLTGLATVPVQTVQSVRQGGSLTYYFVLQNGGAQTVYRNGAVPFQVQFIDTLAVPVSNVGSVVVVPDTALPDGKTSVVFAPGVLSNPGTLVVRQQDPFRVAGGPAGLPPIVVYDFELQGASLLGNAGVTLSYPSNADGSLIGSNGSAANLSLYGLQGPNWLLLGPRQWNSTLHTVSGPGSRFATYALFLSAGNAPADLRPRRRILTPNGDGINDTVDFTGIGLETVQIFDVKGQRIKTLQPSNLAWDGTDESGRIVESGLYLYQYTSQGERVSGVILIAK